MSLQIAQQHLKTAFIYSKVDDLDTLTKKEFDVLARNVKKANTIIQEYIQEKEKVVISKDRAKSSIQKCSIIKRFFEKNIPGFKNKSREATSCLIPRHCYYYLLRKHTLFSLWQIAESLPLNQDHTTILYAVKSAKLQLSINNDDYVRIIQKFEEEVKF